jgi:excisionase family DNA binding protein
MSEERPELLTIIEMMTILNVSRTTVYRLMQEGEIKTLCINSKRLARRGEIERYITRQEKAQLTKVRRKKAAA